MSDKLFSFSDKNFIDNFNTEELKWDENDKKEEKIRQEKFDKKCRKAVIKAVKKREKQELKEIKKKYGIIKVKNKKIDLSTTTKQIMLFLILNCTLIELYSMYVMYKFQDLTTLDALISAVVAETVAFLVYCIKSYFENKSSKNYDLEMYKYNSDNNIDMNQENDLDNNESYISESDDNLTDEVYIPDES